MKIKSISCALFLLLVLPVMALAGEQDFILVNRTGRDIYAVYMSPNDSDTWGQDIMGKDLLYPGEYVRIQFSPKEDVQYWDLKVADENEKYLQFNNIDLFRYSKITLSKDGRAIGE